MSYFKTADEKLLELESRIEALEKGAVTDPGDPPIDPPVNARYILGETIRATGASNEFYGTIASLFTNIRPYKTIAVETLRPSFSGARVGLYEYGMQPTGLGKSDFFLFTLRDHYTTEELGMLSDVGIVIDTRYVMPKAPVKPFYVGAESQRAYNYWAKVHGSNVWSEQGPQTERMTKLLRSFWHEPFKHNINHDPSDIYRDPWPMDGRDHSYWKLGIEDAISPPLIWAGTPGAHPDPSFIREINKVAPEGSMFHGPDEAGGFGGSVAAAVERIKYLNDLSDIPVMMTGFPHKEYEGLNVINCVPQAWWGNHVPDTFSKPKFGSYPSCMGHGNCAGSNPLNLGNRTQYPIAVVEGDAEKDWRGMAKFTDDIGADFTLYFSVDQKTITSNEPGGLMNDPSNGWGNGDGTWLMYDENDGHPIPTLPLLYSFFELQAQTKAFMVGE